MRCVALLRAVNLGKVNKVPMKELKEAMEALGFTNVSTYILSGNALLDTSIKDPRIVERLVEESLEREFGVRTRVAVRTREELDRLVAQSPFRQVEGEYKDYYTFFIDPPAQLPEAPTRDATGQSELLAISDRGAYTRGWIRDGRSGDPGLVLVTLGKVVTTTRTWTVVCELARRAGN